jgi:hypothetical protein
MNTEVNQTEARPVFRVLAGIVAVFGIFAMFICSVMWVLDCMQQHRFVWSLPLKIILSELPFVISFLFVAIKGRGLRS